MAPPPANHAYRVGRVQAAIRRALWGIAEATTGELLEWAYENAKPWQRRRLRRSAHRVAVPAGKRGRETLWRLRDTEL